MHAIRLYCEGRLNPRAHPANEKYLADTCEDQQRAEWSRERHNPARFIDRFPRSHLNFFPLRGHSHLRMYQRGDAGRNQQYPHDRNRMKSHMNNSAAAEMTRLLRQRMNNLT